MFVWVIISAIIGARALHVLSNLSFYSHHPGQVIAIWQGGLSSFGGLLFAVPVAIVSSRRRCPQLPTLRFADLMAPVLMASWGIGRLLGPQLMVAGGGHQTHQWFGMYYAGQVGKRLPVPIFQSIEDFTIFGILLLVERWLRTQAPRAVPASVGSEGGEPALTAPPPAGIVLGVGMVLWGIERFLDEHLWLGEDGHLGSLLVQGAGIALAVIGAILLASRIGPLQRWRRGEDTGGAPVREPASVPSLVPELPDLGRPEERAGPGRARLTVRPSLRRLGAAATTAATAATTRSAAGSWRTTSNTAAAVTSRPVTVRPTAGPRPAKRRWKARNSVGVARRRVEQHGQPAHETEPGGDRQGDQRPARQDGEDHHQVDGGGGDVGGHAGPDLPAEPGAVDPGAVPVEPALVDLTTVDGHLHPGDARIRRSRDQAAPSGHRPEDAGATDSRPTPAASTPVRAPSVAPPAVEPRTNQAAVAR